MFFFLKGVGGAELYLAMNHWKSPTYILKMLKLLWKFGISDTSSGPRDTMVKAWRWQWWRQRDPRRRRLRGLGGSQPPRLPWETTGPCPRHPSVGFGGVLLFVCFGCFLFFSCRAKEAAEGTASSQTGSLRTLGETLDTALQRPQPGSGLRAPEKITHASCWARAELLGALWPTPPAVPTVTTALFQKRDVFLVSLFSFDWNDTI